MEPVSTTTAVMLGLGIASTMATGAATYMAYESAQDQKKAVRDASAYNQAAAEQNAQAAQAQAAAEAKQQRDKVRRVVGAQRAAMGKSGASMDGSFDDVAFDTAVQGELDALNILYKGDVTASRYRQQGTLAAMEGSARMDAADNEAAGSLIGGFARTADRGYDVLKLKM